MCCTSQHSQLYHMVSFIFQEFLSEAKRNTTLREMFAQDKVVLFLHLLGIDTNGHAHKPYS